VYATGYAPRVEEFYHPSPLASKNLPDFQNLLILSLLLYYLKSGSFTALAKLGTANEALYDTSENTSVDPIYAAAKLLVSPTEAAITFENGNISILCPTTLN